MFGCSVARSHSKMIFEGKRILIVGTGKSGIAAAGLLDVHQAKLVVFDGNKDLTADKIREKSKSFEKAEIITGELPEEVMETLDMAVISPGVPTDLPMVQALRDRFIPVIGEVELAYQCAKGKIAAITGTNGKTTTTSLTGEILAAFYKDVKVVGNIGIPYTSVADETTEDTVTVAEISSFQLETTVAFKPDVSAILNITPDHLNRHHTMENYIAVKESITKNQGKDQTCILNYEDEVLREFGDAAQVNVLYFSSERKLERGYYLEGTVIFKADGTKEPIPVIDTGELNILGKHNYENAMAAIAVADTLGVPMETIRTALKKFQAVEHRIEFVTEKNGVRYYNDSKGTNPDAAIKGICAMDRPTYLIGGGYDKDSEYDEWIRSFDGRVRKLVLIGATREKIAACCEKCGFVDYLFAETLEEAVSYCHDHAKEGEAVLLSPACASWDMFKSYEERGTLFKEYVNRL